MDCRGKSYTDLKLASCSKMLWLPSVSSPHVVAFGAVFVVSANLNNISVMSSLMFRPVPRACLTTGSVKLRPSWGRKPWFASVLSMGQGPRATINYLWELPAKFVNVYIQSPGPAGCQLCREPWALTTPTAARATNPIDCASMVSRCRTMRER
jgi:hypothetical protein